MDIVVFVDEARPGNVLRPDKGRATQAFYWAFAQWPEWYLCRSDAWLPFGFLRSGAIEGMPGGISSVMASVLHQFFGSTDARPSFAAPGGQIVVDGRPKRFRARLGGLMGDEKGMKEVFNTKGPNGSRPCLSCKNCVQLSGGELDEGSFLKSARCPDPSLFVRNTDAEVYEAADLLRDAARAGIAAEVAKLEKASGIVFDEHSLLFDAHCRTFVRPVTGWLRDWMHIFAVGGCANIEIEQLVATLLSHGVAPSSITDFFA